MCSTHCVESTKEKKLKKNINTMADKLTPRTWLECTNLLPTEHSCGLCFVNYVCDICSQQCGVPEGIFRCNECAPNPSNLPSNNADANIDDVATSWSRLSVQHGAMEKLVAEVNSDNPQERNHRIPETGDLVVAEKGDADQLNSLSSDVNANDINTSWTDISVNNGAMDKLVAQVDNNDSVVHNHTSPEIGESVVTWKGHDDQLKPSSGDAVDIT